MKLNLDKIPRDDPAAVCTVWGHYLWQVWHDWRARPTQIPGGDSVEWLIHLLEGGRGSGKTRPASEWIIKRMLLYPQQRAAVLGMDFQAVEDTCVYGESGLLSCLPDEDLYIYRIGKKRLDFHNGSQIQMFSSERPKKLKGPQHHAIWIDEPAELWNGKLCFDNIRGGLRLPGPEPAQMFVTGTPKAVEIMDELHRLIAEDPKRYTHSVASMKDNIANLADDFVESMMLAYPEGTAYHQQEILGLRVLQAEGALWQKTWIDQHRVSYENVPPMTVTAIAVDPADSTEGDKVGILVGGQAANDMYVFADYTLNASTLTWVELLPDIAQTHGASKIVVEGAFLGQTARTLLENVSRESTAGLTVEILPAKGDKVTRARPVASLSEAGRIHHVTGAPGPDLGLLEAELTTWEPGVAKSPNRLDAYAYLGRYLLLDSVETSFGRASQRPRRGSAPRTRRR